jgi:hypothetical protein
MSAKKERLKDSVFHYEIDQMLLALGDIGIVELSSRKDGLWVCVLKIQCATKGNIPFVGSSYDGYANPLNAVGECARKMLKEVLKIKG